jgi:paraquat-inducible protein A
MGDSATSPLQSIASRASGPDRFVGVAAAALMIVHLASVFMPALQVKQFFFFKDTITIWDAIAKLFERGEWVIGPVLFLFTIAFPLFKLFAIIHLFASRSLTDPRLEQHLTRLESIGRWSMLDVMVAALMIVSLTATGLAEARFLPGMYLFTFSVVATLLLSSRVGILARRFGENRPG